MDQDQPVSDIITLYVTTGVCTKDQLEIESGFGKHFGREISSLLDGGIF